MKTKPIIKKLEDAKWALYGIETKLSKEFQVLTDSEKRKDKGTALEYNIQNVMAAVADINKAIIFEILWRLIKSYFLLFTFVSVIDNKTTRILNYQNLTHTLKPADNEKTKNKKTSFKELLSQKKRPFLRGVFD